MDPDQTAPKLPKEQSGKFQVLIKTKFRQIKMFLALSLSNVVFIMLQNVKMPTIVGILTFMSRIHFVLT